MNSLVRNLLKFGLFLSIGATILYLVYQSNQKSYEAECLVKNLGDDCSLITKIITDFKSVKIVWLFIIVVLFMISNIARALRWDMMLRPLGYICNKYNLFFTIMLGYFANLGIPRSGELIRAASLAKYENIPVEKVVGTIVLDRLMDVICLLLVMILGLSLEGGRIISYLQENASVPGQGILRNPIIWTILVLGLLVMIIGYIKKDQLLKSKIGQKIYSKLIGFYDGIMSIFKLDNPWLFIGYSLGIWLLYYLMTYLCFFAFAPTEHLGAVAGLTVFIFGTLGMVIPSPGGMGSYHYLVNESLTFYGVSAADGFSFANIIFFSISIFCNILFGIISLIALPIINRPK